MEGMLIFYLIFVVAMIAVGILFLVLWIKSFFDILKSEFSGNNKIVWIIVMLLVPPIGLIAYRTIGVSHKVN